MKDFLLFKRMLAPILIQVVFWLGVLYCLFTGINAMINQSFWRGLWIIVLGIITVRIACEILMLFFRIYTTLMKIAAKG